MLTESFVTATFAPDKSADKIAAGIQIHELQPLQVLKSTFKKTSSKVNCVAVSNTHIFAAQADKAVVHVFSRERSNQEATIPFPERIGAIALAGDDDGAGTLVLGTEGGRIILWELGTGRQISTPQHHLQSINCLAVDLTSNHLLSGSGDSAIHVWSIPGLLSFHQYAQESFDHSGSQNPLRSLSNHRAAIIALKFGHSTSRQNIAVSISADKTCLVWDFVSGVLLQTYLLADSPQCLTLDPVDRAAFVGCADGTVHFIDFYKEAGSVHPLYNAASEPKVTEAPLSDRWIPAPDCAQSPVLCMDMSYDGTVLISGQQNGRICSWDTATGKFTKRLLDLSTPVTTIMALHPSGFRAQTSPSMKIHNVVKPRYEQQTATASTSQFGEIPIDYSLTAQFLSEILDHDTSSELPFNDLLSSPLFPQSMLEEALAESHSPGRDIGTEADRKAMANLTQENASLMAQLKATQSQLKEREREAWRKRRDEEIKAGKKRQRRLNEIKKAEMQRKTEMGESAQSSIDQLMPDIGEDDLSSSTDELLDTD